MNNQRKNTNNKKRKPSYSKRGNNFNSSKPSSSKRSGNFNSSRPSGRNRKRGGYGKQSNRGKSVTGIDIRTFIEKAQREAGENTVFEITNTFEDFTFAPVVKKNLQNMGFTIPTPIQDASIPHIMAGEDVIGLANTGTGKTGAFLLPLITKVLNDPRQKVLIIAPTRELVLQIDNEFREFAKGTKIQSATVIGGVSSHKQIHNLLRNPNFVVGTPGRLKDLSDRKALRLQSFNNVVLDEVDRMLDMGFLPSIKALVAQTHESRQSLFFSATLPDNIKILAEEFMKDPVIVKRQAGRTTSNVQQEIIALSDPTAKFNALQEILSSAKKEKVLVFSETKRSVEKLAIMINKLGVKSDSIHGDKSQFQRQRALAKFKENKVDVLVATDVAARGLDIKGVTTVVNYTIPQTYDDYVHRIGRTGRASAKGRAITFVSK